jgi:iron-sulfur cluster assembly accessory protein
LHKKGYPYFIDKEAIMLQITQKANEMISSFLKEREELAYVRIFLSEGGCCSGPSLGMALDEPQDNDEIIKDEGINYLINKDLLNRVKPINIDFVDSDMGSGFTITSTLSKENSCGSCSCC